MSSVLPPQIGFIPSGVNTTNQSQVIIGGDNTVSWNGVGYGPNGGIDLAENVKLNLTLISGTNGNPDGSSLNANPTKVGVVSFSAGDLSVILANASTLTFPVNLTLTEIMICNNGQSGRMIVLGSQPYN